MPALLLIKKTARRFINLLFALRDKLLTQVRGQTIEKVLGEQARLTKGVFVKKFPRVAFRQEHILILIPCKNTAPFLPRLLANLSTLTYPHKLIDIGFVEGDSTDNTYDLLEQALPKLRRQFASVDLYKKDFHYKTPKRRWKVSAQRARRSVIAAARNHLLRRFLRPKHDRVLWIDGDVIAWPADVIERLLSLGKDILMPHCVNEQGRTFDTNAFKYVAERKFNWQSYIKDGLLQPPRGYGRTYPEDYEDHDLMPLDGVGATMLLIKADLHRQGLIFPEKPYHLHIETEGLAFMARAMGQECWATTRTRILHPSH